MGGDSSGSRSAYYYGGWYLDGAGSFSGALFDLGFNFPICGRGSNDVFVGGSGRKKKVGAFVPWVSDAGDLEVYDSDVDSRAIFSDLIFGRWVQESERRAGGYFQSTFNSLHRVIGVSHLKREVHEAEDRRGLACNCRFAGGCDALR